MTIGKAFVPLGTLMPTGSSHKRVEVGPLVDDSEGHLITIAPTGAGKGVSCIIPAMLAWDGPAIVIDPKGEIYEVTHRRRIQMGQKVEVLDPFGVTSVKVTARLNPIDLVKNSRCQEDDAALLARLIRGEARVGKDPYWDERAETLIANIILEQLEMANGGEVSLDDVRSRVEVEVPLTPRDFGLFDESEVCEAFNRHNKLHGISHAHRIVQGILRMAAPQTRSGIISSAASHTSFLKRGPITDSMVGSTIRFRDVELGMPLTIYLVLPPDKLRSHAPLLRLWLGVLMTVLSRRKRILPKPTLLLIDEAAQLGPLEELRTAVTLLRGYGVKVWSFWQDFSQLTRLYPDWETILNNCAVQQFFGADMPLAALRLDALLEGTAPCPVGSLAAGESILIRRGQKTAKVKLPNYLTDPRLARLASANPFYRPSRRAAPNMTDNLVPFPRSPANDDDPRLL